MKLYLQLKAGRLLRSQSRCICNAPFLYVLSKCSNTGVCLPFLCLFLTQNQNVLPRVFFFVDKNIYIEWIKAKQGPYQNHTTVLARRYSGTQSIHALFFYYGCNIYPLYVLCFSQNGEWEVKME